MLPDDGWYADFQSVDEHVVVFASTVFRYRKGDTKARDEVIAYGHAAGRPVTSWIGETDRSRAVAWADDATMVPAPTMD